MSRIIAIVNQKAMSGKSTTAQFLAKELLKLGKNAFVVNLDPIQLPDLIEIELVNDIKQKSSDYIKKIIAEIRNLYDIILLDTPSSLGLLTTEALSVADTVIIPIKCTNNATDGLMKLLSIIKEIKEKINDKLCIDGLLMTMFNPDIRMSSVIYNELHKNFDELLYNTVIRKDHFEDYRIFASEFCKK